jgi:hypothetical protein
MFTDRDGKFQLLALAESGFDPLARTCRFMLTEEAHHMFVGQTGVGRVIERTCQVMKENPGTDVKQYGAIPMDIIQKYINFWSSSSTDLYGAEVSSNSANFFSAGLKGRAYEERHQDHKALEGFYDIERFVDGKLVPEKVPLRNAMNEVLRDEYVKDNAKGISTGIGSVSGTAIRIAFRCTPQVSIGRSATTRRKVRSREAIDEATWNAKSGVVADAPGQGVCEVVDEAVLRGRARSRGGSRRRRV